MSAFGSKADIALTSENVRFSNRPVWVKRFQTIHCCSVDVVRGLVLLKADIGVRVIGSTNSGSGRLCRSHLEGREVGPPMRSIHGRQFAFYPSTHGPAHDKPTSAPSAEMSGLLPCYVQVVRAE